VEDRNGKYLTFSLENETYGIPIQMAKEIIGMQELTHIPKTKEYAKGVMNLRGKIIPVVDLRLKFGMNEKAYSDRTCIIVIEVNQNTGRRLMGIIVDSVTEVRNIQQGELEPPCAGTQIEGNLLLAIAKLKDKVILIIDIEKIINQEDAVILNLDPASK